MQALSHPERPDQEADSSLVDLWRPLQAIVGKAHVRVGPDTARYRVGDTTPRAVVLPGTIDELSRVLAFAHRHRLVTVPWGSGSQIDWGAPIPRIDLVCSLERMNQLLEYEPADMTLAVQAGMPLASLQALLAERGQFLPLDPPVGPTTTVGGLLSTRASGPLRAGYGTLRDRLLGVRVVLPDGRIAKAGGRVVKNVAGYDMGRLYTGALGTLVVVAEVYLKVHPLPARWGCLVGSVDTASHVEAVLAKLMASEVEAVALEVINPVLSAALGWASRWHLALGFAGTDREVTYLRERSLALFAEALGHPLEAECATGIDWEALHQQLLQGHRGAWGSKPVPISARVHLLSSHVAEFMDEAADEGTARGLDVRGIAHGLNGIVRLHIPAADAAKAIPWLRTCRARAEARGGSLVIERAPVEVKNEVGVWGEPRGDFPLFKAIKAQFDPHGILNPGRFVGGL